jgi:thiosulfate dehydrogenase
MNSLRSSWCPICLGILFTIAIMSGLFVRSSPQVKSVMAKSFDENSLWTPPDPDQIPADTEGDLIRYGKELVSNTSYYLGPKGIVAPVTNGMNCQNCHLEAGARNFANPFSSVRSTYPKFRNRSGRIESVEFRINECLQRSLNGKAIDSLSYEMRAFVAYLNWIGNDVPDDVRPKGSGTMELVFLDRAADPVKGRQVYVNQCQRCHGTTGEGVLNETKTGYVYPPLWGEWSYNISAGMYRLSTLAGFIRSAMPFDKAQHAPVLSYEEAWDAAAFIVSQQRPVKRYAYDWPLIDKKPADHPFGPYADPFSETQHKYGPFLPILSNKKGRP